LTVDDVNSPRPYESLFWADDGQQHISLNFDDRVHMNDGVGACALSRVYNSKYYLLLLFFVIICYFVIIFYYY